uniref:Uncharacterized protein n=1 Tax=Rhizophagus irregularis (strain DAOM 181602 / DAOM 197198 / MUCL 43194) TaxID=747089 RepID=U9U5I7_RHIID
MYTTIVLTVSVWAIPKLPKFGEISETWRNFRNLAKLKMSRVLPRKNHVMGGQTQQMSSALKEEAKACGISGGGLKKWVDTRWHTMYDCVDSIMRHKVPLENLKCEKPKNLSTAVLSVLRSRAFFDDKFAGHEVCLEIY